MDRGSDKKSGILLWPKKPVRPIPPQALPCTQLADNLIEMAKDAHTEELQRQRDKLTKSHDRKQRRSRRKTAIAIFGMLLIGVIGMWMIADLRERNEAPERVLKEAEAQRAIIFRPVGYGRREDLKSGDQFFVPLKK